MPDQSLGLVVNIAALFATRTTQAEVIYARSIVSPAALTTTQTNVIGGG